MIRISSSATVGIIGQFLCDSGYDVGPLSHELDLSDGLYANQENLEPLLARTDGDSKLALLARLFFVCWPVQEAQCRIRLTDSFVDAALECGLLVQDAGELIASAAIFPLRSRLIACDSARTRTTQPDMVTGPSASTHFLARLAVSGDAENTLDLGTGTGVLALEAARYSRSVIGTDINERALQFARFNAALNGIENVDWRCGDAFVPVAREHFTRIIANPPFFLTPGHTFTYCDSPLELDGFTARLARECSTHLEEGGYYQMICEWVEVAGESWEQRLRDWTAESKCDVLVLLAPRLTPIAYAEKRTREASLMQAGAAEHSFQQRLSYLRERNVTQVLAGVISLRKRSGGSNWFSIFCTEPAGSDLGGDLQVRFDALTYLSQSSTDDLLQTRLRLASDVVLNNILAAGDGGWQGRTVDLQKTSGLVDKLRLDETVSAFIPLFNGERTVAEIASVVCARLAISRDEATQRAVQLARRLIQSTFVLPVV
jgi:methylase of polypeptide subunit release factors